MQDPQFHSHVRVLFHRVAELPVDERRLALASADAPPEVVDEVRSLLGWATSADDLGLLAELRPGELGRRLLGAIDAGRAAAQHGQQIGPYRLLRVIGAGGMGTVYLAEQHAPVRRQVALKLIRSGMDSAPIVARFAAERQALARMSHPFIAGVLDGGATADGLPFFVMELVEGRPITAFCDAEGLSVRARLALFVKACRAVQHAHQKGVIHRDIKPSNVLVVASDDGPIPKVIDFGVAKATEGSLTDATLVTGAQQLVGTLEYMAPEQLDGPHGDVDTRVDVYALGVLLFELLTGTLPFEVGRDQRAGIETVARMIRTMDAPRPSARLTALGAGGETIAGCRGVSRARLCAQLRGELDWIVGRALEKERDRRYDSAAALAQDVQRYLDDETVVARPPSRTYRLRKLVRRNRIAFLAAAAVFITLVGGAVAAATGWAAAVRANSAAQRQLARATAVRDVLVQMWRAVDPRVALGADTGLMRGILDQTAARLSDPAFGDEVVRGDLHLVAGRIYLALGAQDRAEHHFTALLALDAPELQPLRLDAQTELVGIYRLAGRFDAARELLLAARSQVEQEDGEGGRRTLALRQEAVLLDAIAAPAAAVARQTELVATARDALGDGDQVVTDMLVVLGSLLRDAGLTDEAAQTLGEALARTERRFGPDAPESLAVRAQRLWALFNQSRYAECEQDAWVVHEGSRGMLGDEHPATLLALGSLATVWAMTGRPDQARPALERVLAQPPHALPDDDPNRALFTGVLAAVHTQQGDDERAIELSELALAQLERLAGAGSPRGFPTRNNLVALYTRAGRLADAAALANSSLPLEQQHLGHDHEMTLALALHLAEVHRLSGRPAEALRILDDTVPKQLERLGPSNRFTRYGLALLALAEEAQQRPGSGLQLQQAALDAVLDRALRPTADPAQLAEAARQLLEHPEPSLRDPARALVLLRRVEGPDVEADPARLALWATALRATGELAGAADALRRALARLAPESPLGQRLGAELAELEALSRPR